MIIADHYSLEQQQKLLGVLHGTVTLAMTFAPIIGSYISLYFHWQGNFILLLAIGLLSLVLSYFWIPVSKPDLTVRLSIKEYFPIFTSPIPFLYVSIISLLVAAYWIFIAIAPILYMGSFQVSLAHFGLYQGSLALVFSLMSFSSGYWIRKFGQKACFNFGIKMLGLFCIAALGVAILDIRDPKVITSVLLFSSVGALFPINLLYPFMLESIPNAKGRISSVQVGGRLLIAALCIQVVSYFYAGSFKPLGVMMVLLYLLAFFLGVKLFKRVKVFE